MSATASALGQALCIAGKYDEGALLIYYKSHVNSYFNVVLYLLITHEGLNVHLKSIADEESLVGVYHYRIATKYLQAAACAMQAGQYSLGSNYLSRTKETMRRNPHVKFSDYDRASVERLHDILQEHGGSEKEL